MKYKEGWTPLSTIKFCLAIKIRSVQDNESGRRFVGSDINCSNPCDIVSDSISGP